MKDKIQQQNSDDDLIDEITAFLRDEQVPSLPRQLLEGAAGNESIGTPKNTWLWTATWAAGIAAGILAIIGISVISFSNHDTSTSTLVRSPMDGGVGTTDESAKTDVRTLSSLQPFTGLEQEIDAMKSEIEQLKIEAASLDAIRKVNALLVQN